MERKELICIGCPMGCMMSVELEQGKVTSVTGNTCKRGDAYARKEVTNPTRIVTSTVQVDGGLHPVVSVKTNRDIPKDMIETCMKALKRIKAQAPVKIGDVIAADIGGTGADIVATKAVLRDPGTDCISS